MEEENNLLDMEGTIPNSETTKLINSFIEQERVYAESDGDRLKTDSISKSSENKNDLIFVDSEKTHGDTSNQQIAEPLRDTSQENGLTDSTVTKSDDNSEENTGQESDNVDELKEALISDTQPNESGVETQEKLNEDKENEWMDILGSGQLKKKILRKADNEIRPTNGHICEIKLQCCLENGTVVEEQESMKVQLGDLEVVHGLDLALALMNVGEKALIEMSSRFGYGSIGLPPNIPPDSKLLYTIELLSSEYEQDLEQLSIKDRKEIGIRKRERGNWWFSRQDFSFAIQCYRRALEYLDEVEGGMSYGRNIHEDMGDELKDLLDERLKVFNNMAACQLKLKAFEAALGSVETVLRCQPNNVKALFRKAKILAAKGENAEAVNILRTACQLEPDSQAIRQELLRLVALKKQDAADEKNLYKKMFTQNKSNDEQVPKQRKFPWNLVFGSIAAVVVGLGAMAYRYKTT